MISQAIPNCYLVGTMNAIINNPTRRCEFYQMFSEDEKSIIFTFKDGFNVKFPKDKEGKPKLLNNQHDSLNGSIGYQMFEEAYALHRLYDRAKNGYKKYTLLKNRMLWYNLVVDARLYVQHPCWQVVYKKVRCW